MTAAGNVEVPAYLVLLDRGYAVRRKVLSRSEELWIAEKNESVFSASGPIELLGVVSVYEHRGADWHAPDDAIENFVLAFTGET